LGNLLGDIFTNSSGHPAASQLSDFVISFFPGAAKNLWTVDDFLKRLHMTRNVGDKKRILQFYFKIDIIALLRVARWYFFIPKSQFGHIFEDLGMENICIFCGPLEYVLYSHLINFTAIWYILRPFGIFYGHLDYLGPLGVSSRFGMLYQQKSGNPALSPQCKQDLL
jgi:hypothetical protein